MRLDFKTDLKKLGKYIAAQPTAMMVAKDLLLDVDWLLKSGIKLFRCAAQ